MWGKGVFLIWERSGTGDQGSETGDWVLWGKGAFPGLREMGQRSGIRDRRLGFVEEGSFPDLGEIRDRRSGIRDRRLGFVEEGSLSNLQSPISNLRSQISNLTSNRKPTVFHVDLRSPVSGLKSHFQPQTYRLPHRSPVSNLRSHFFICSSRAFCASAAAVFMTSATLLSGLMSMVSSAVRRAGSAVCPQKGVKV